MKKRILAFALSGLALLSSVPVYAASSNSSLNVTIGSEGLTVDSEDDNEESEAIDYEKEYAYDGEDYVYAKVTFKGKSYAVNRSDYGSLISTAEAYGTSSDYFVGYTTTTSQTQTTTETLTEPDPPDWDRRTPWDDWDDDMWLEYYEWADNFTPDDYQKKLLDYYSTVELYAYYIGQYSIDEGEYMEYVKAVEDYQKGIATTSTTQSEETTTTTPVNYENLVIQYDLFSIYSRSKTYCITADNYAAVTSFLNNCEIFNANKAKTTNPNAFQSGKYFFEIGTTSERMTEYVGVDKDTATKAIKYISSHKIKSIKSMTDEEKEDVYVFRVCTKKNNKNQDKAFYLKKADALVVISDYLGSNTKASEKDLVVVEEEDDAKG